MDVNEELKFLGKVTQKKIRGGGGRWRGRVVFKIEKEKKKLTEPGLEPTTSGLEIH